MAFNEIKKISEITVQTKGTHAVPTGFLPSLFDRI